MTRRVKRTAKPAKVTGACSSSEQLAATDAAARLIASGFDLSGRWKLDAASRARFIGEAPKQPGVYAYAVDGDVRYVGSAQRGLAKRMRHYEITETMRTAFRVRGLITEVLKAGSEVAVLTIVPGSMRWKGLPVDLIAGLEMASFVNFNQAAISANWGKRQSLLQAEVYDIMRT